MSTTQDPRAGAPANDAHDDELGPLDTIVIEYPAGAAMTGEAAPLMVDLIERGIVRLLDIVIVAKDQDGAATAVAPGDPAAGDLGSFAAFEGASTGLLTMHDVETIAEAIEPGSVAVAIVYENRWAAPFAAAVRRNGGTVIANQRIPVEDLVTALDAAEAAS